MRSKLFSKSPISIPIKERKNGRHFFYETDDRKFRGLLNEIQTRKVKINLSLSFNGQTKKRKGQYNEENQEVCKKQICNEQKSRKQSNVAQAFDVKESHNVDLLTNNHLRKGQYNEANQEGRKKQNCNEQKSQKQSNIAQAFDVKESHNVDLLTNNNMSNGKTATTVNDLISFLMACKNENLDAMPTSSEYSNLFDKISSETQRDATALNNASKSGLSAEVTRPGQDKLDDSQRNKDNFLHDHQTSSHGDAGILSGSQDKTAVDDDQGENLTSFAADESDDICVVFEKKVEIGCAFCSQSFADKKSLMVHSAEKHESAFSNLPQDSGPIKDDVEKKMVKCAFCPAKFVKTKLLMFHVAAQHPHLVSSFKDRPHPASAGTGTSQSSNDYRMNLKVEQSRVEKPAELLLKEPTTSTKCFESGKNNFQSTNIQRGRKGNFHCSLCPAKFRFKKYWFEHVSQAHQYIDVTINGHYECPNCSTPFKNRKLMMQHIFENHSEGDDSSSSSYVFHPMPNRENVITSLDQQFLYFNNCQPSKNINSVTPGTFLEKVEKEQDDGIVEVSTLIRDYQGANTSNQNTKDTGNNKPIPCQNFPENFVCQICFQVQILCLK